MDDLMLQNKTREFFNEPHDSKSAGRWTAEEHGLFLQGLKLYNKQWKLIADLVKTRTVVQIRTHAQKYFQKLEKGRAVGSLMSSSVDELSSSFSKASSRADSITSADGYDICLSSVGSEGETDSEPVSARTDCFEDHYRLASFELASKKVTSKKRSRASSEAKRSSKKLFSSEQVFDVTSSANSNVDPLQDFLTLEEMDCEAVDESIMCLFESVGRHHVSQSFPAQFGHLETITPSSFFDAVESINSLSDSEYGSMAFSRDGYGGEFRSANDVYIESNFFTSESSSGDEFELSASSKKRGRPRKSGCGDVSQTLSSFLPSVDLVSA